MTSSDTLAVAVQLLDASAEWIAVKDLTGRFVAANLAFTRALHADRASVPGARNEDFFGSDAGADLSACEHLALLAGESIEQRLGVSIAGELRQLRVVCTPWMDGGMCAGLVLAYTPETPDAASANRTLHAYASAVGALAHKFNNALTTVIGLADWHLVAETHDAALRADLEKIRAAAQQAEQTAQEIQQLTRRTAASLVASTEPSTLQSPSVVSSVQHAACDVAAKPVLLVDDEPSVRASLTVMVRTLGHEVHAVGSAAAAMSWLDCTEPSVVLTDFEMPGVNGAELAALAHARRPTVPVVLMTGWGTGTGTLPPHVSALLPKPLRMAQLRQLLERLTGATG